MRDLNRAGVQNCPPWRPEFIRKDKVWRSKGVAQMVARDGIEEYYKALVIRIRTILLR